MSRTDEQLKADISRFERWAEYGAGAVIAGLVIEIGLAWYFQDDKSLLEVWGSVGATGLITLGVAVEVLFSRKARARSEEFQEHAEAKIAGLGLKSAEANERAAQATARANEAVLALEQYRAPRKIPEKHREGFIKTLSVFKDTPFDLTCFNDPESLALMNNVVGVLGAAGWRHVTYADSRNPTALPFATLGSLCIGHAGLEVGIKIHVDVSQKDEWGSAVATLAQLLKNIGMDPEFSATQNVHDSNAVHIKIGKKP